MIITVHSAAVEINGYMGTPLLHYRVQDNILPDGEYVFVRSFRNVTQILIVSERKFVLYTDRENDRNSDIFVSAYSLIGRVILSEPSINQHEFDMKIDKILSKGDMSSSSSIPFHGADKYMDEVKRGIKPEMNDGEYFVFLKDNGKNISLMTLNPYWKKMTIRNMKYRNDQYTNIYNVYIDESYDRNIRRIIIKYSSIIKNSSITNN